MKLLSLAVYGDSLKNSSYEIEIMSNGDKEYEFIGADISKLTLDGELAEIVPVSKTFSTKDIDKIVDQICEPYGQYITNVLEAADIFKSFLDNPPAKKDTETNAMKYYSLQNQMKPILVDREKLILRIAELYKGDLDTPPVKLLTYNIRKIFGDAAGINQSIKESILAADEKLVKQLEESVSKLEKEFE